MAKGQEAGFGGPRVMPIGRNELDRALEIIRRDSGIVGAHFLIRPVVDAIARKLLPVKRPVTTEPAVTVIDQNRSWTIGPRLSSNSRWIFGVLLHDLIND